MKKKTSEKQPLKSGTIFDIKYSETSFEAKYSRYFWLTIPLLTILYYSYRQISVGFYQDDEVAQYINMLQFWHDPWVILGNFPKPGYKIFAVIPALISYDAVMIFNSFIAALTVYLTYYLIKLYKLSFAYAGALLLASQPLFVDLSFRSYSEIFTSLCIVVFLLLYKKENFALSALVLGFIFTIRQEIALLIIIIGIFFIRKKMYRETLLLLVFPVVYNVLGYIKTGDVLFVLSEMQSIAGLNYKSQGILHYFKVYIFIVGPISLSLFLLGFFGFLNDRNRIKEYISMYSLPYLIFTSIFIIQMLTMVNDGPNPGNWRYLLHISPVCALFAAAGLNNLSLKRFINTHYAITGIFALIVLLFLSYATDGFRLLDNSEYIKFGFIAAFFAATLLIPRPTNRSYALNLSIAVVLLSFIHLYFVEPKKLSAENISVKETAEFVDLLPGSQDKLKLSNHSFIQFYSAEYKQNPGLFKNLNSKTVKAAPKGSLIIWESHYGYRPEFHGYDNLPLDVPLDSLQSDPSYRIIKQFISSDKRFASFIFEKQ